MSTLGELLEKERRRYFTDRENEITLFKRLLELSDPECRIVAIHGIGGIGKTVLLEEFRQICKERKIPIAKVDVAEQRSAIEILKSTRDQLGRSVRASISFRGFDADYKRYLELQAKLQKEGEGTFERVTKVLSKVGGALDPTGIVHRIGEENIESAANALYRFLTKPEADFYLRIDEILTGKLLKGLDKLAKPKIVIMFDAYEQALDLDDWVRDQLVVGLPGEAIVVISGRRKLGDNWAEWRQLRLMKSVELLSFSNEATREYLEKRGIEEAELVEEIFNLSEGHPLCVAVSADLKEKEPELAAVDLAKESKRFLVIESLIRRVMEQITDPLIEEALEAASIVRYFNEDTLRFFLKEKFNKRLFAQLQGYSFVRWREDGLAIHDLVREFLNRELKLRSPDRFGDLNRKALALYEQKLSQADQRQSRKLVREQLYHLMSVEEERGIQLFVDVFFEREGYYDLNFCQALLNDAKEYTLQREQSRGWIEYCRGDLLLFQGKWQEAVQVLSELLEQFGKETTLGLSITEDLVWSLVKLNKLDEAIRIGQEVVRVYTKLGTVRMMGKILRYLGSAYFRQGKMDLAQRFSRESVEVYEDLGDKKQLARSLNLLGVVYRGVGRWDESAHVCKRSVQLCREMKNEYQLGKALHNLGQVLCLKSELDEALGCLREAFEIFQRLEDDYWVSNCLNGLGRVCFERLELDEAAECFEQGLKIKEGMDDSYGVSLILRWQGDISFTEGHVKEARSKYTRALEISAKHGNKYMETVLYSRLSRLSCVIGEHDEAQKLAEKAERIAAEQGYLGWLAECKSIKADLCLHRSLYGQFFANYAQACKNALMLNKYLFEKMLSRVARHIQDFFDRSEVELAGQFLDFLISFWEKEGLGDIEPSFVSLLQSTKEFLRDHPQGSIFECGWPNVEVEIRT